ncbi:MAG: hypothetical protein P1U64_00515 [Alcanivoracaceae bacterium]|jgi:hypothetical protein|nr:hypothetical protein [Alcanivoracaceae bacterium]
MQVETFSDVLDWTRAIHRNLANCLETCADDNDSERVRMLMDYLGGHERELARVLEQSKDDAEQKALHTWVYDYFENAPLKPRSITTESFENRSTDEVLEAVMAFHEEIIKLYKYLQGRAEVPSTRSLIDNLLQLEEQETRLMMAQAHRFDDL